MFRSLIISLIVLAHTLTIEAQFNENVWCFGDSAGIDFNGPAPIPIKSNVKTRGACTSICDSQGNLLFYANNFNYTLWTQGFDDLGVVYNSSHEVIDNGDSLICRSFYNELMIVPDPSDANLFWLFQIGVSSAHNPGLYYSIIDRQANSGQGGITQKNVQLSNIQNCDGMHAVRHANGRDWWLVTKNWGTSNNTFQIYIINPNGISLFSSQDIGSEIYSSFFKCKFSPDGSKMAGVSNWGLVEIYDFDRCNGTFTNVEIIDTARIGPVPFYWGVEFSRNGDVLYVSKNGYTTGSSIDTFSSLVQFDLTSSNIFGDRVVLDTIHLPYRAGALELGSDDKIYFTSRFDQPGIPDFFYLDTVNLHNVKHLGVIHQPNVIGHGCDFRPFSFYLGGERTYYGLPNNPNYLAGAIPGTVCDSLGLGITDIGQAQFIVSAYPNPVEESASIIINAPDNLNLNDLEFELYSSMGLLVKSKYVGAERIIYLNREDLSSGSYFYRVYSRKHGVVTGKLLLQ